MFDTFDKEFLKSITSFYFSCGGYFGVYSKVTIERTDNCAIINVSPAMSIEDSITETVKHLSVDEWQAFINAIFNNYRLGEWDKEYIDQDIDDGTQWSVKIKFGNKKELEYYGSNDYPPYWTEFVCYINALIAFSGVEF